MAAPRARDRQLPAIQWAIIGAGIAAGFLTMAASMSVMVGESSGEDTTGWWSATTTLPAAVAAAVCVVVYVVAAVSRTPRVRSASMWTAVGADVVASLWLGVTGVLAASQSLDVYGAIDLAGALAAATVLTVPVISAVKKDRDYARENAAADERLAAWLES